MRSLIGLDREAAKEALAGFLDGKVFTASQIDFIDSIADHLTEHGLAEPRRLYESPPTDLTPQGPDALFMGTAVDELIAVLESVRRTAVAA